MPITCYGGGFRHNHPTREDVAACQNYGRTGYSRARAMNQTSNTVVTARVPAPPMDNQLRKMLLATKDGRYAVRPDDETAWTFIRLSRPKNGRSKGLLKIQYQASEAYLPVANLSLTSDYVAVFDKRFLPSLMLVVCDPTTGAYNYGRALKRCSRCYKELTDDRSIYYAIGPECEKHWPEVIAMVNEKHGMYVHRDR